VSPTLTTFLLEAANFLVLAAVLGRLFFKPVRQALADHRARLEGLSREATQQLAAAEQTRAEVVAQRQTLRDELTQLRAQILEAARQEAETIVAQAREQALRAKQAAQQQVERFDEMQMATLSRAVAAAAGVVVGRLLTHINGPTLDAALLRAACEQLRGLALDSSPVIVESAEPLSENSHAVLDEALGPAATTAMRRVVPELGAGLRITTPRGVVDASVMGLAAFAQRALTVELEHRASQGMTNVQ
jgi:F-type H+-transporting ATPase subunit b